MFIRRNALLHLLTIPQWAHPRYKICDSVSSLGAGQSPLYSLYTYCLHIFVIPVSGQKMVLCQRLVCPGLERFLSFSCREVGVRMRMTQMTEMMIRSPRAVHLSSRTSYRKSLKCQKRNLPPLLPPKLRCPPHCPQTHRQIKKRSRLPHPQMVKTSLLHQRYHVKRISSHVVSLVSLCHCVRCQLSTSFHISLGGISRTILK